MAKRVIPVRSLQSELESSSLSSLPPTKRSLSPDPEEPVVEPVRKRFRRTVTQPAASAATAATAVSDHDEKKAAPQERWSQRKLDRERDFHVRKSRTHQPSQRRPYTLGVEQLRAAERLMVGWLKSAEFHMSVLPLTVPEVKEEEHIQAAPMDSTSAERPHVRYCEQCQEMHVYFSPKRYRTERPPPLEEHEWRWVQQNSALWDKLRKESAGASSAYTTVGWSEYKHNVHLYLEDTGQVPLVAMNASGVFMCGHGHRHEDKPRQLYAVLLHVQTTQTGYWLHEEVVSVHASPDGFSEYADTRECIHPLIFKDSLRGIHEIKCSIFGKYMRQNIAMLLEYQLDAAEAEERGEPLPPAPKATGWQALPQFAHKPKCEHVVQMQYQGEVVAASWNDYINMWLPNALGGAFPVLTHRLLFPYVLDETKQRELQRQIPLGSWVVGELTVTRVYQSESFGAQLIEQHLQHLQAVQARRPPPRVDHASLPGFQWLPLLHVVFVVTGSANHLAHATSVLDLRELMQHVDTDSTAASPPKPSGWRGEWPPRLRCFHQTFEHVAMQYHTLQELKDL